MDFPQFPAITLWQPWASLVACGAKTWETRGWPTKYRGPLRIHASAKVPADWLAVGGWSVYRAADAVRALDRMGGWHVLPLGALMATVNLVDCVRMVGPGPVSTETLTETLRPGGFVVVGPERLAFYRPGIADGEMSVDISDQREFGIWEPGRWAWRLEDIAPTTERCPLCLGERGDPADEGWSYAGHLEPGSRAPCPVCDGVGSCDPVPAKGGQRIWRWRP